MFEWTVWSCQHHTPDLLSSSGSEFETVGPATGKARGRPYVLSRQRGTMSRCWLAERSRCRDATSMAGVTWSARYCGACPCTQRYVMRPSLKVALSGTSNQCSSSYKSVDKRSNFRTSLTIRNCNHGPYTRLCVCACADLVKVSGDATSREVTSRFTTRPWRCITVPLTCLPVLAPVARQTVVQPGLSTYKVRHMSVYTRSVLPVMAWHQQGRKFVRGGRTLFVLPPVACIRTWRRYIYVLCRLSALLFSQYLWHSLVDFHQTFAIVYSFLFIKYLIELEQR